MIDERVIWDSWIPSVIGGVLAGLIVIMMELLWRGGYVWIQRRKAVTGLRRFFAEWEERITTAKDLEGPAPGVPGVPVESVKFVLHKSYLRTAPIRIAPMTKHLSDQQAQEVSLLLSSEEAKVGIIPEGRAPSQDFYDQFFDSVKGVKWLKYG